MSQEHLNVSTQLETWLGSCSTEWIQWKKNCQCQPALAWSNMNTEYRQNWPKTNRAENATQYLHQCVLTLARRRFWILLWLKSKTKKTRRQCHPDFLKLPLSERLSAGSKCLRFSTSGCSRIAAITLPGFWNEFRIKVLQGLCDWLSKEDKWDQWNRMKSSRSGGDK